MLRSDPNAIIVITDTDNINNPSLHKRDIEASDECLLQ